MIVNKAAKADDIIPKPIYSIILAMLLFSEAKELNAAFYIGLGVIILSVILQTLSVIRSNKKI